MCHTRVLLDQILGFVLTSSGEGGQRSIVDCASCQHDAVPGPKAACQRPTALLIRWPGATPRWHKQHGVDRDAGIVLRQNAGSSESLSIASMHSEEADPKRVEAQTESVLRARQPSMRTMADFAVLVR